jgi:hypothetical protein
MAAGPEGSQIDANTGQICAATSGPGSQTAECRTVCMPDEQPGPSGCCVTSEELRHCPAGQSRSTDTAGYCCWQGQVWAQGCCVGRPTWCPSDYVVTERGCGLPQCADGHVRAGDGIHCCWPEQAWSSTRRECVGDSATQRRAEQLAADAARQRQAEVEQDNIAQQLRQQRAEREKAALAAVSANEAARTRRTVGWVLAASGLAVGATAIYLKAHADDLESQISRGGFSTGSDISSAASAVNTNQALALTSVTVGGISLVTGVLLVLFNPSTSPPQVPSVGVFFTPRLSGVSIQGGWF